MWLRLAWIIGVLTLGFTVPGCVHQPRHYNVQFCTVQAPPGWVWEKTGQPARAWFEECGEGQLRAGQPI